MKTPEEAIPPNETISPAGSVVRTRPRQEAVQLVDDPGDGRPDLRMQKVMEFGHQLSLAMQDAFLRGKGRPLGGGRERRPADLAMGLGPRREPGVRDRR